MRIVHISTLLLLSVLLVVLFGAEVSAQDMPERHLVREGNRQFDKRNYRSSLNRYNEALEHDSTSYEALYNRANSYQRLRMSDTADSTLNAETAYSHYEAIAADTLLSREQRAEVLRNLGESLVEGEKYEAALNAFRKSLMLNPDDQATKYNYVLTKRIVDQKRSAEQQKQQNDEQQNQDNQDNQQNQDNQDNQQNQDNQDNQQNNSEQDNNQSDKPQEEPRNNDEEQQNAEDNSFEEPDEQEGDTESQPRELSADQERMLDAIQAEEDKTQEKIKEGEKAIVIRGKKNW